MKKNRQIYLGSFLIFFVALSIFSRSVVYGQITPDKDVPPSITNEVTPPPVTNHLLSSSIFNEDGQFDIIVNPVFDDNSTNISFYIKCPSRACKEIGTIELPVYIFSAENLGHGSLPLAEYWAVPAPTSYVAIEYKNDNQQFSCSSLTFEDCLADEHFIKSFNFEVVASGVAITKAMTDVIETENIQTTTVSDALLQLSISLSSTSISSSLNNGLIVTASLDGIISIATTTISTVATTETNEAVEINADAAPSSFLMDIVENVIEIFIDKKPTSAESTPVETKLSPELEIESVLPTEETLDANPALENEVQSPMTNDEVINNEITTTTF